MNQLIKTQEIKTSPVNVKWATMAGKCAFALASAVYLTACTPATMKVSIEAVPDDASIYVNGENYGKGAARVDVGPEYNFPKSMEVEIKKDGYRTLYKVIENKFDTDKATQVTTISLALALLNLSIFNNDHRNSLNLYAGVFGILFSPVAWYASHKFNRVYQFEMEAKSPEKTGRPSK